MCSSSACCAIPDHTVGARPWQLGTVHAGDSETTDHSPAPRLAPSIPPVLTGRRRSLIVTPLDLEWHVSTAIDRLLLHPALFALLAAFLMLRDGAAPPAGAGHEGSKRSAVAPT